MDFSVYDKWRETQKKKIYEKIAKQLSLAHKINHR
jgi:hypothetical protein